MDDLSFDDYKDRISIQEVLQDAGYHFYRRDGVRWPCYYRLDNEGRRIHGDKFIVCANGKACFQPPEIRKFNVISFIAEHTNLFPEGCGARDPYTVVNDVCRRLLGMPKEERERRILEPKKDTRPFLLSDYECERWEGAKWESQTRFFPFFKPRAITRATQRAFSGFFLLAAPKGRDGARQNLSFPMRIPGSDRIVGLEQRGLPDGKGKPYKGMAKGTNATEGVWLACPKLGKGTSTSLDKIKDVYWFESALDAMAFFQQRTEPLKRQIDEIRSASAQGAADKSTLSYLWTELRRYEGALYVSTGGSPSLQQLTGVLKKTPAAAHHACFDNDRAGHVFAVDLLLARAGRDFQTSLLENGQLQVIDRIDGTGKKYTVSLVPFEFDRIAHLLDAGNPDMREYDASLRDRNDPMSGDYGLLPAGTLVSSYCDRITALEEQRHSGELFRDIPEEQRGEVQHRYDMIMSDLWKGFTQTMTKDIESCRKGRGSIDIEVPPAGYKDWNDVTMEKRQYDDEDIISAMGEDGEVITGEVNQDHEEEVKRDGDDEEETIRRHTRR